jgi:hypothetical protein
MTRFIARTDDVSVEKKKTEDISLVQTRDKRRKSLHGTYGFHCGCSQCSLSDAESEASDQRVEKIRELWDVISDWDSGPPSTPAMADEIIELFKTVRCRSFLPFRSPLVYILDTYHSGHPSPLCLWYTFSGAHGCGDGRALHDGFPGL